jgi:DNA-directed RNA polymerase subunit RPC12/RpoP
MVLTQAREDKLIDGLEALFESNQQEAVDTCMNIMACYICSSCSEPFCGGRVDCANDASLDLTKIRCQECNFKVEQHQGSPKQSESDIKWRGKCSTHGYKFAIYKCDSCCSVAVWDCRSNHYCERCHNSASSAKNYPCPGLEKCPLGIPHPQNKSNLQLLLILI